MGLNSSHRAKPKCAGKQGGRLLAWTRDQVGLGSKGAAQGSYILGEAQPCTATL